MTPAMRKGLQWFADQDAPVGLFDADAPRRVIRERLEAQGFIARVPSRSMFMQFAITDEGRAALAQKRGRR